MGQCFCWKAGVPPENVRDSFVMERGRKVRKKQDLFPRHISNWLALLFSG